ncbi:hypothetical protein PG989_013916 [Apiospora arundinis]
MSAKRTRKAQDQSAPRKRARKSYVYDSIEASLDFQNSSPLTPSASPPTPRMAAISAGRPSLPFPFNTSDVYQVPASFSETRGNADWNKYLLSLGFGCEEIFGALRGTALHRYSTVKDKTEIQEREKALLDAQTEALVYAARTHHKKACNICGDPVRILPDCPRKEDAKNVKFAYNEFKNWHELFRPHIPRKGELETHSVNVRIQEDVTVKAVSNLLYDQPYMRYEPGDYLLQLVGRNEATEKQRALGFFMEPSENPYMHLWDDIIVADGIVPFKPHQDLERLDEVCPTILKIAIAILGFKPGATSFVPDALRTVLENSELSHQQWEKLVEMWDFKFKQVSQIPEFIRYSVAEARTKLSEAAWIIRRLRGEKTLMEALPQRDIQLESMEKLLCRMTETTFEKLADQHLKQLSQEALDCIYDGETDRVLVYVDGAFDKETYRCERTDPKNILSGPDNSIDMGHGQLRDLHLVPSPQVGG